MYHIIVNPSAKTGLGRAKWRELKKLLDAEKITYIVHFTKSAQDTCRHTRSITDPLTIVLTPVAIAPIKSISCATFSYFAEIMISAISEV